MTNEQFYEKLAQTRMVTAFVQAYTRHEIDDLCLQCCHRSEFAHGFLEKFLELCWRLAVSSKEIEEAAGNNEEWNKTWRSMVKNGGYPSNTWGISYQWPGGCDYNSAGALVRALERALKAKSLKEILDKFGPTETAKL